MHDDSGYGRRTRTRGRTRMLRKVTVPDVYPQPGTLVYLVITPSIWPKADTYRPRDNFVLETAITKVSFTSDGKTQLEFEAPFEVEEYFLSRASAELQLKSFSEPGTKGPIYFVSQAEMKANMENSGLKDVPF